MASLNDLLERRVYLDTNIFIYALNGFADHVAFLTDLFEAIDRGQVQCVTSEFTAAELLVIPFRHEDAEEEARCRLALQPRPGLELFPVTRDVLEEMARIRASRASLRAPDTLHLATARLAGCDVFLTNDLRLKAGSPPEVVVISEVRRA